MFKKLGVLSLALMLTLGLAVGCAPENSNDPLNTDPILNDDGGNDLNDGGNDGNDILE